MLRMSYATRHATRALHLTRICAEVRALSAMKRYAVSPGARRGHCPGPDPCVSPARHPSAAFPVSLFWGGEGINPASPFRVPPRIQPRNHFLHPLRVLLGEVGV